VGNGGTEPVFGGGGVGWRAAARETMRVAKNEFSSEREREL
jgi:hypothetical protein